MFNMFGGLFSANKFKMLPSVVYRLEMVADKGLSTKKKCVSSMLLLNLAQYFTQFKKC